MSQKAPGDAIAAKQGHRYTYNNHSVLALNTGRIVRILSFDPAKPWFGKIQKVPACFLTPEPMAYFHGEIPQ